ncbi:unnamed protein product [Dovyalis caffra]|uniref:Uncharacterized protein n=1 Tax=Dovyalis caffra TaxID=77055 RepID=A0AAV1SNV9_9ROSI|nr:unnamed protein product [Dovyalis caffra]
MEGVANLQFASMINSDCCLKNGCGPHGGTCLRSENSQSRDSNTSITRNAKRISQINTNSRELESYNKMEFVANIIIFSRVASIPITGVGAKPWNRAKQENMDNTRE